MIGLTHSRCTKTCPRTRSSLGPSTQNRLDLTVVLVAYLLMEWRLKNQTEPQPGTTNRPCQIEFWFAPHGGDPGPPPKQKPMDRVRFVVGNSITSIMPSMCFSLQCCAQSCLGHVADMHRLSCCDSVHKNVQGGLDS
jgi:hypothetical protein